MSRTRELLTGFGEEQENASIQKAGDADLWKMLGRVALSNLKKSIVGGSGICEGTPHEERRRKDDAI